jgi:hypothetical protein
LVVFRRLVGAGVHADDPDGGVYRWSRPPTFPGDPDIGLGLLMLVAFGNVPLLTLTWLGWFVWRMLSARKNLAIRT